MQYVAKHTSIPIPTVHDVWRVDGITYIVMDLVQGVELEYAWRRMSERAKERVVAQLTDYLAQLRALPPIVDGVISSIHGKYLRDHGRVGLGAYGPFKSHDDFHRYLRINFSLDDFQKLPESNEVMIAHRQQYTTKLTHGDLAPRNILVKMDGTVTAILDWDSAGWFPEYWEYTKAHFAPYAPQDWVSRIGDITGRYEQELEAERQLYELCGYYIT
ncbi:kinase-like domain-containing protein [Crassisporium funariophilum]|nr:kinase-like domain-containing protein [Crassisporium funariophilum]